MIVKIHTDIGTLSVTRDYQETEAEAIRAIASRCPQKLSDGHGLQGEWKPRTGAYWGTERSAIMIIPASSVLAIEV